MQRGNNVCLSVESLRALSRLVRLGVYNSKVLWLKYFVLHKSTGAAEHKPAVYRLFFAFERACRGASDSWTAKQHWGQRRHGNREIRQCFCGGFKATQSFLLLEGKASDEECKWIVIGCVLKVYLDSVFILYTVMESGYRSDGVWLCTVLFCQGTEISQMCFAGQKETGLCNLELETWSTFYLE